MKATQRIELAFWDWVVLVLTNSIFVRRSIQTVSRFLNKFKPMQLVQYILTAAFFGLAFGFLLTLAALTLEKLV